MKTKKHMGPASGESGGSSTFGGRLGRSLLPGLFSGLLAVVLSVSFAALIFGGSLSMHVEKGISMALTATIVAGLMTCVFSRLLPVIVLADEDSAPVFALLATLVAANVPATTSAEGMLASIVMAVALSTVVAGVGLLLLGRFQFGGFIQFLPQSVMGGYFAAVGWLLVVGGFQATMPLGLLSSERGGLVGFSALISWPPALAVAVWLVSMKRRLSSVWLLPVTIVIAMAAWYFAILLAGQSPNELMSAGLLIGPFEKAGASVMTTLHEVDVRQIQWHSLLAGLGGTGTLLLISVLSLMFSTYGLGLLYRQEVDLNHELTLAGTANIISGLGGGMLALPSYGLSRLASQLGAEQSRIPGMIAVGLCALMAIFGLHLIAWTPRFVLGGLLMYLGVNLIREWLVDSWREYSPLEYLVIPIILLVTMFIGFLQGILTGLLAAVILFVVKYSQTRVIRFTASGSQINSNVDRNARDQELLESLGDCALVLGLQGFLFFGTAGRIYDFVRNRAADPDQAGLAYLIFDFSQVSGVDASAALNFRKIERLAGDNGIHLVLSALETELLQRLEKGGFGSEHAEYLEIKPDLDRALEWVENRLIVTKGTPGPSVGCLAQLQAYFAGEGELATFRRYLEERQVGPGDLLARQGDSSTELIFVETVAASAFIDQAGGQPVRVRTTEQGTVYGELGFYLATPRTATVLAEGSGLVYLLSREALARMEQEHPEIAAALHRFMARLLSERLLNTTQTLKAVLM